MRQLLVAILLLILGSTGASAQWISQAKEDPFGKNDIVFALSVDGPRSFGVRCVGGKSLEALFDPNERADGDTARLADSLDAQLLLRIDREPIDRRSARVTASNGRLLVVAELDAALVKRMADARERIAATVELLNNQFGTSSFGVKGSRNHIGRVLTACKSG